jgi:head-tail adaptor
MLPAEEITSMRDTLVGSLPDTVTIQSPTLLESDGTGGFRPTFDDGWADGPTVQARVSQGGLTPQEQAFAAQIQAPVNYVITVPFDIIVTPKDRIKFGSRIFHVHGTFPRGAWNLAIRAICSELQ